MGGNTINVNDNKANKCTFSGKKREENIICWYLYALMEGEEHVFCHISILCLIDTQFKYFRCLIGTSSSLKIFMK